jgi:hypothetical protein
MLPDPLTSIPKLLITAPLKLENKSEKKNPLSNKLPFETYGTYRPLSANMIGHLEAVAGRLFQSSNQHPD